MALQVEDFMSSTDTTPLSSVPVQFVVRIWAFPYSSCYDKPELVIESDASLLNGSYFEVLFNTSWRATITTRENSTANITEFVTASPIGMEKSINPGESEMNVTWTPFEYQLGPNIFCYAAIDNIG